MMNFTKIFENINLCYVILDLLGLIVGVLFLNTKDIRKDEKFILCSLYVISSLLSFQYLNGIVENIFKLKYLGVKTYLVVLIITNLIILSTLNKNIKLGYKIANYILFILLTIIFGSTAAVVLGNRFETFYIMDVSNAVNFIDLSLVIFMIYLIVMAIIYIGYYLFDNSTEVLKTIEDVKERSVLKEKHPFKKQKLLPKLKLPKVHIFQKKKRKEERKEQLPSLSIEELLNYDRRKGLYIDGVECSIIFEDSNQENIIQNYNILSHDIHAKMMNGYTLEENRMLKNICAKLNVGSLSNIDIHNVSILNRISVEEYNLLKRVFGA